MQEKNNNLSFRNQCFFIGIDAGSKSWKVTIRSNYIHLRSISIDPSPEVLVKYMKRQYPEGKYFSVYEAGFCGFGPHRQLLDLGINNIVVNPADIPTTHKEKKNKTDKVDSNKLSRELEKFSLRPIYVPDEFHEQLRSLSRTRYALIKKQVRIKNQIKSFLYYHGIPIAPHAEKKHWSRAFIEWLRSIDFTYKTARSALDSYLDELEFYRLQVLKVVRLLRSYVREYDLSTLIGYLVSVSGVGFITAITFYCEIVDIERFPNLDNLHSYLGLVPSVYSTGDREGYQKVTSRYNKYLRNLLIEASWKAVQVDPVMTMKYGQLLRRMSKQKAIIRIAKKLVNRLVYVWKHRTPYDAGVVG